MSEFKARHLSLAALFHISQKLEADRRGCQAENQNCKATPITNPMPFVVTNKTRPTRPRARLTCRQRALRVIRPGRLVTDSS